MKSTTNIIIVGTIFKIILSIKHSVKLVVA
jgi:hypothetical protein